MAKFYGEIGFGVTGETSPGVWEDTIIERKYYGDVIRNTRRLENGENLNNDITINNSISIVADAYANENFVAIRYIKWMGSLWSVTDVEVQAPRLLLRIGGRFSRGGGVHNGPTNPITGTS